MNHGLSTRPFTQEEAAAARKKWKQIEEDINRNGSNEWAGTYVLSTGELHRAYLRWSPQSGFVSLGIYTCMASVTSVNYGGVKASVDSLELLGEVPLRSKQTGNGSGTHAALPLPESYLFVKWGERHYLIHERSIANFYKYVSGLEEPDQDFFVKIDDIDKPIEGMPVLPPGYERFVKKPIEATIIKVGVKKIKKIRSDDKTIHYESVTPITINIGRNYGVERGMSLYIIGSSTRETVEIVSVGESMSIAIITRSLDDDMKENYKDWDTGELKAYPEVSIGWKVTTSWELSRKQ